MKTKFYILIIFFSLFFSISERGYAQILDYSWVRQVRGDYGAYGYSMVIDPSGNIFTTGSFKRGNDFNPGPGYYYLWGHFFTTDIFVSKFDSTGNLVWAKSMGGDEDEEGRGIALDPVGNVYITGLFQGGVNFSPGPGQFNLNSAGKSDIFIVKLNSSGNLAWAKRIGGTGYDGGNSIAVDTAGNVYTTGYFRGKVDFDPGAGISNLTSAGSNDIFISKLDSSGNFVWAKSIKGTGDDCGKHITLDAPGNIYTTGYFSGTADFDTGSGTHNLSSSGYEDIFVSKSDNTGNFLWTKQMGGSGSEQSTSMVIDNNNCDLYTTGYFDDTGDFNPGASTFNLTPSGGTDIFISKLDSSGNFIWAKGMGGEGNDASNAITLDSSHNVYTTGSFRRGLWGINSHLTDFDPGPGKFHLTSSGAEDLFISKLSNAGDFLGAEKVGGNDKEIGFSIATDVVGNLFINGSSNSWPLHIGDTILDLVGYPYYPEMFIARLNQVSCNAIACNTNSTIQVNKVTSIGCNNGQINVHTGSSTFQAYPHIELYDSLNTKISSVNLVPGTPEHIFKNLSPGNYTVKVFDYNCCEQDIQAVIPCADLISGLKTTNITTSSAKLKWKPVSCAVSYRVQYREQGASAWNNRYVNGNQGVRTIVNLTPSTTYEWRVANMCNGMSTYPSYTYSPIQTFTTLALRASDENISNYSEQESFEINLFPNPATYMLTVNFETEETSAKLKVVNTVGQVVFEKQLQSDAGSFEEQLDISKFSNGMYVVIVETENGLSRRRFAKE